MQDARDASATRRWEMAASEARRAELVSWAVSLGAGAAWIALVHLTPVPIPARMLATPTPTPGRAIPVVPLPPAPEASSGASGIAGAVKRQGAAAVKKAVEHLEGATAFGATLGLQTAADVARILGGVQAAPGGTTSMELGGGKVALSSGRGGATPGLSRLGGGDAEAPGAVRPGTTAGRSLSHSSVVARPLPVVSAPGIGGAGADVAEVGGFVRARTAQLRACYELQARDGDGALAGVVTLRLTLGEGGAVRDADVVRRTWSGPGAEATERCLLGVVRRWTLPSGDAGSTVVVPISFTAGR